MTRFQVEIRIRQRGSVVSETDELLYAGVVECPASEIDKRIRPIQRKFAKMRGYVTYRQLAKGEQGCSISRG